MQKFEGESDAAFEARVRNTFQKIVENKRPKQRGPIIPPSPDVASEPLYQESEESLQKMFFQATGKHVRPERHFKLEAGMLVLNKVAVIRAIHNPHQELEELAIIDTQDNQIGEYR